MECVLYGKVRTEPQGSRGVGGWFECCARGGCGEGKDTQTLSMGSRRNDECSVTRVSRVPYSTLMDVLEELHPRVQFHHFVRCHTCPAPAVTALGGLEESPAAQVALSAP